MSKLITVNVALPFGVPTPFSKKQPPPKEKPMRSGFVAAAVKPSGRSVATLPFQFDQWPMSIFAVSSTVCPAASFRATEPAPFDHQYFEYQSLSVPKPNAPFVVK